MIEVEHDLASGALKYVGWALPGADLSDPAWRIAKFVFSGAALSSVLWADGDDLLDNVWSSRASLTYLANDALTWLEGHIVDVALPSLPASLFTFAFTIPSGAVIWLDSTPMRRVSAFSGLGTNEFKANSATQLETAATIAATSWAFLRVPLA